MNQDENGGSDEKRNQDQVLDRAFVWLMAIRERPDDANLRAARDAWVRESEHNASAYAKAERVWGVTGRVGAAGRRLDAAGGRQSAPRMAFGRRGFVAGAVGAAAAAIALVLVFPMLQLMATADHYTGIGEVRQVAMEDGTAIVLNADSAIAIRYAPAMREIVLLRGDAFFAVKQDPSRPFVVRAGNLRARALGTAFAVQMTSAALSVAVENGRVRVDDAARAQAVAPDLSAGDQVTVDRDRGVASKGAIDAREVAAWRQGRLFVEDATLGQVVEELGRYHRGTIVIGSRALGSQRVTGVYDLRDTEGALRAAVAPFGGVVRKVTPYLFVVSAF